MKIGVYLVEDSEIMSTLLKELLEGNGASIVGHADTARTAIADQIPELLRLVRSLDRGANAKVSNGEPN